MARISLGSGVFLVGFLLHGCGEGSERDSTDAGAGAAATGATSTGAADSGGAPTGGSTSGGATPGGRSTGGATSGGSPSGGRGAGGTAGDGGTPSGTGGSHTGGATTGGARTGGAGAGGVHVGEGGLPPGGTLTGGEGGAPAAGAKTGGAGGAGSGAMMGCYVGVQADDCCSRPVAADSRALGNPCLVPYDDVYDPAMLDFCPGAASCMVMDCTYFWPASRVVTRDDTGTCVFTDECDPDTDPCIIGIDYHDCCACPEMLPRALVEDDPCVAASDEPAPTGCVDCSTVRCGTCPTRTPTGTCETRGEMSILTCVPPPSV